MVRPDGCREAQLDGALSLRHGRMPHYQDRRRDARPTQLFALVDADDAQAVGAGGQGGRRDARRAVAVGIRLHDGHQQGAAGLPLQRADVVVERVEVDVAPNGASQPG